MSVGRAYLKRIRVKSLPVLHNGTKLREMKEVGKVCDPGVPGHEAMSVWKILWFTRLCYRPSIGTPLMNPYLKGKCIYMQYAKRHSMYTEY